MAGAGLTDPDGATRPPSWGSAAWHRRVWALSVPIIVANVTVPLLGIVDTAVVGHLDSPEPLGAVAIGAQIFAFVFWGFGFLRMGTTALVAQAHGAGDGGLVGLSVLRASLVAGLIGTGLIALQAPVAGPILSLFGASPGVEDLARTYVLTRIWAAPATLLNYVMIGFLFGMQRTRWSLVLVLVLNLTNIALSLVFVVGFGWGVMGVALASVIAEWLAVLAGGAVIWRQLAGLGPKRPWQGFWDGAAFARLMSVNANLFIRTLCLITGFAWFMAQGARQGDLILAANAILWNFQMFASYACDGFAHAAEALVGNAVGKRSARDLDQAVRATTVWAAGFAAIFAASYALLGPVIIDAMTDQAPVREAARIYLGWAIVLPVLSVWSFQLDGIFIGATRGAALRNAMVVSLITFLAAGVPLTMAFGNHGLWAAFALFMIMRGVTLAVAYPALARSVGSSHWAGAQTSG